MTDKKDVPPKAGDRKTPETGGAKRPFATIDVKAVEVPADPQQSAPKAPEAAVPRGQADAARRIAMAAAAQRTSGGERAAELPQGETKTAASAARPSTTLAGSPKVQDEATDARRPENQSTVAAGHSDPRRRGSFLSHAVAGIVGGLIVLATTHVPIVAPVLESIGLAPQTMAPEVAQRLAVLERRAAQPSPEPARATAAIETNSKAIATLQQQLVAAGEAQAQTARLAADIEARLAKAPPIADVGERLLALEKQLTILGKAATEEPDRAGRIPQLASLLTRFAEIEGALNARIADARKDAARDLDTRLAPATEASETARATAQRLEREVSVLRGETNRVVASLDQMRTAAERQQLALKAVQDQTAELAITLDSVRRDLEARLKSAAKPDDVSAAVAPIASQLAALERNVAGVVKSEGDRNATAERIVLSLELGNLKRAMERGAPYGRELAEVAKLAGSKLDLASLQRYRDEGVPTVGELTRAFRPVANAILDADAEKTDGSVVDRLMSGAKTFVRVRKTTSAQGDASAEATVARIEEALRGGRLADVLTEAKGIERKPEIAKEWLAKVEARQSVDSALKSIGDSLKASLGGGAAQAPAAASRAKGQP